MFVAGTACLKRCLEAAMKVASLALVALARRVLSQEQPANYLVENQLLVDHKIPVNLLSYHEARNGLPSLGEADFRPQSEIHWHHIEETGMQFESY